MYGIALSVAACLRAGTRADVAWSLDPHLTPNFDANDAVAITPGGGRLGGLLGGAIDSRLIEEAAAEATAPRVLTIEAQALEAALLGIEPGTVLRVMLAPADTLPAELWERLLDRSPVALSGEVDSGIVTASRLVPAEAGATQTIVDAKAIATTWHPRPMLVVMGGGPMAEAIAHAGSFVGWKVERANNPEVAVGLATSLSSIDGMVVMGHDTEAVGRVLQTSLGSTAGYIGSIGPHALQQARADWLAYRGITDLDRVNRPAGLDIGANSPPEIAISVVAEMIQALNQGEPAHSQPDRDQTPSSR